MEETRADCISHVCTHRNLYSRGSRGKDGGCRQAGRQRAEEKEWKGRCGRRKEKVRNEESVPSTGIPADSY